MALIGKASKSSVGVSSVPPLLYQPSFLTVTVLYIESVTVLGLPLPSLNGFLTVGAARHAGHCCRHSRNGSPW